MRPHLLNTGFQSKLLIRSGGELLSKSTFPPDASEIQTLQLSTRKQKDDCLSERLEQVNSSQPSKAESC